MWWPLYLYIFLLGFLLSLLLTTLARKAAVYGGILDMPGERKAHARPVPLLGGAAILGACAAALLLNAAIVASAAHWAALRSLVPHGLAGYIPGAVSVFPRLGVIMLGGTLIFLLGLWDDLRAIPPRVKLLGQVFVALVLVSLDLRVTIFVSNYAFSAALTVFWIVAVVNAFNLLDNMDGLCAGVAVIAASFFFGISAVQEHYFIALLLSAFVGSLLAFLRYNFPPARIFMGDAGSMFVGYFIAVLAVMQTYYRPGTEPLAVLMPVIILAVPIYDTLSVIAIRVSRGESIFKADRRHFSHRLVSLGMSPRGAVCFIYLVTLSTGLSAVLLPRLGWPGGFVILAQTMLIVAIIAVLEYFGGAGGHDG